MTNIEIKARAKDELKNLLKPGDTVYTVLLHVSRSGMLRVIKPCIITSSENSKGKPYIRDISHLVADACGMTLDKNRDGIRMGGFGMDMGFNLVYCLSSSLWPTVPCTGEGCNSNDHSNGDRDYTVGKEHKDGGYALNQQWL